MTEKKRMEIADLMSEMIALGWTLESFDQDFDQFITDEALDKEECREIFQDVWDDRMNEVIERDGFTGDSFGANCPSNWEEICSYLNGIVRQIGPDFDAIWERYCNGEYLDAPEAVFQD